MKKLSTLAALAGALTMTVATAAHADSKSSSMDKAATPCVGDKCVKTKAVEGKCGANETKAAEGKCGANKTKAAEGKCGEGKCGSK
nr:hypothetical protein [uncultured Haemophilus sp.]